MKGIIGSKTSYQRLLYGIKGYNRGVMKILKAIYISSKEGVISFRLQVINFQIKYGTRAAVEAYKISRATIFRWKKRLKEANFEVEALMDKSKVPKNKRKRKVPKEIEDFIIEYRERDDKI